MLCDEHAQRLSPPRGWVVIDRRDPQSSIVAAEQVPLVDQVPSRPRIARRWGQFDEPRLEFTGDAGARAMSARPAAHLTPPPPVVEAPPLERRTVVAAEAVVAAPDLEPEVIEPEPIVAATEVTEPVAEAVVPEPESRAEPEADAKAEIVDDLSDLMKPTGRLLSRAFKSGGDQKSVLTVAAPNDDDR